jgi:hypothetical protein
MLAGVGLGLTPGCMAGFELAKDDTTPYVSALQSLAKLALFFSSAAP